jgi:hypothetical protein
VHFFAQISHSGGTSAHFRKFAKIAKFPNLARVHTRALFRACRNTNFSRMKNYLRKDFIKKKNLFTRTSYSYECGQKKKNLFFFFHGESALRAPATQAPFSQSNGHSGACRKDGVLLILQIRLLAFHIF